MGEIKSPGNLEGQSEQGGGLKGRYREEPGVGSGRGLQRRVKHRAHIKHKRHKGNLQMQGWEGGKKNAFQLSHASLLTWTPFPRQGQQNHFTYGGGAGPSIKD